MAWFKNDDWREILVTADKWRQEAGACVDDPHERPQRLGTYTYKMMELLDKHSAVDPMPLWDLFQQIQVQTGMSTIGARVSQQRLETMMMQCVGVLERLKQLGTSENEPEPVVDNWPRQADVARGFGMGKMEVHRLIEKGELLTNGKTGHDCRVNPASILEYCDKYGIAYNDT